MEEDGDPIAAFVFMALSMIESQVDDVATTEEVNRQTVSRVNFIS